MLNIEKNIYTKVLEILQNAGAKAVGFDIVFQNPDKNENIFAQKLQDFKNAVIAVVEPNNNHKTLGNFSLENCTDTLGK